MTSCVRHYEEPTADTCRTCRNEFCSRCLVYAFGPSKPPYCVGCALAASGVRSNRHQIVVHQADTRRPTRAERKAEKAARKLAAKHAKTAAPIVAELAPEPLTNGPVPAPAQHDGVHDQHHGVHDDREFFEQTA